MVYIFDADKQDWITADISLDDPLPGTKRRLIMLKDFCGPANSGLVWSDTRALEALELLLLYAAPHELRYAFRRVEDNAHRGQSAHYAGLAFHIGGRLSSCEQSRLIRLALDVCGFDYVEPNISTPGWVHVEKSIAPPAGLTNGYPKLSERDRGVHVLLLQDVLRLNGLLASGLTGCFCSATAAGLRSFQATHGLNISGKADALTWRALMKSVSRL